MSQIYIFIVILIALMIHRYVFSNRKQVWLGAIVPVLFIVANIYLVNYRKESDFYNYIYLTLGLLVLFSFWRDGRKAYKEKQSKDEVAEEKGSGEHE